MKYSKSVMQKVEAVLFYHQNYLQYSITSVLNGNQKHSTKGVLCSGFGNTIYATTSKFANSHYLIVIILLNYKVSLVSGNH